MVIESLCGSELMTERGRLNMTDMDKAFAMANKPEADMRAPTGCVRGCVAGHGFFEMVARVYGAACYLPSSDGLLIVHLYSFAASSSSSSSSSSVSSI